MPCSSEMISQNWTQRNKNQIQIDIWLINTAYCIECIKALLWWTKYINQSIDVSSCRVQRWGQVRDMNVCVYEIKEFIIINRKWPDIQAYLQNCQNVYTSKRNMAVIHSDVKAQLRCNENNFTTDCRHTVTPSLRDKGRGLQKIFNCHCRNIIFNVTRFSEPSNLLL